MQAASAPSSSGTSARKRQAAAELRMAGWSINDIAVRMGIAKSTAFAWVRHVPSDPASARAQQRRELARQRIADRWDRFREERERHQAGVRAVAAAAVGGVSERDVLLLGAIAYRCANGRARTDRFVFVSDDPGPLLLVLRFLRLHGYDPGDLTYRVSVRSAADAEAAVDWWARVLSIPRECFRKAAVRKRVPSGDRHGCLAVMAPRSRELCWRAEGVVRAVVGEASSAYRDRLDDR